MNSSYVLYNKDSALVAFFCEHDCYDGEHFRVSQVADAGAAFPLGFGFRNDDEIEKWLRNRRAPKHRAHVEKLLNQCGCLDMEGYINHFFCASLNDAFWVKPSTSAAKWDDVSLFRNEFNDAIARLAFDGQGTPGADLSSASPELSTNGSFAKCWKRDGDGIFLYKRGSSGAVNAGLEPFSEALAHQIAQKLCDQPVPYELVNHHDTLATRCPLFTSEAVGYAPIVSCVGRAASLDDIIKFFDDLGDGERFRQMMVLDALTLNPDRHLKNFGVSFDTDMGRVIGMAPVFDNNLSLCPYASESDLADVATCVGGRSNCWGQNFNLVAIACLTPDIKERLAKMRDFSFSGLDDMAHRFGFSRERGALLEKLVNFQIDNVLNRRSVPIPTMANPDAVRLDSW